MTTLIGLMLCVVPLVSIQAEEPVARPDVIFTDGQPSQTTLNALATPLDVEFFDTPLGDAAAELSDLYSIHIYINGGSLESLGLDASQPITGSVRGISLQSALASFLDGLELVAVPGPIGIEITSLDESLCLLKHAIYPVQDLLQGPAAIEQTELEEAIVTSISPDTWEAVGGEGALRFFRGNLVVSQTWGVHQQIRVLLNSIRATQDGPFDAALDASLYSERHRQLDEVMQQRVSLEYYDTPLSDAMAELADRLEIPINIDNVALERLGLDSSEPLTFSIEDQPADEALRVALGDLELAWILRNEAVWIVSEDVAAEHLVCRLYPIGNYATSAEALQATLVEIVEPDSWVALGGEGSLVTLGEDQILLVRQTEEVHASIDSLLEGLDQLAHSQTDAIPSSEARMEVYRILQHPEDAALPLHQLQILITENVNPQVWEQADHQIAWFPGRMVITATPGTHREVRAFVERLGLKVLPPY